MLDTDTKRRIDTARQILVGKVPDPKSQVEQITIALIYKFMDDMDAESEEFGGKRKFFAKEFARYGWAKLMRSGLGGHETLNLYAEAIDKMPANPGIPPLFRDIFKNAYLPYRDPETLKMFLKVIDEFTYDHSEKLGDAFEYLLSVLGSQGDAGQFRTPRHIIDFMVEIVDPKKTETVLDPACGTAGFLISAYKHILRANTHAKGHSSLTPDEKGRLAQNFTGYDISPDMVRLSLVNMYLHGFPAPHIYEYDTLTSQDRWNEYADVILANPPFMSPKGGIKPHNRFGVQSKRSEVLFVDYMAEHLTPNGRAAIIVPEGIIFQSGTAYKQLRKMLVENALVAVVSLPAGVFNPYAGVKTSILFLDKSLAKRTDKIAFFKVENDGFDLGAQRRSIDKNDLPAAVDFIHACLQAIRSGNPAPEAPNALVVEKAKIAKSGEYNLSGERYREAETITTNYPLNKIGDICEVSKGTGITRDQVVEGNIPVIAGGQTPSCYHNQANRTGETITVSASGAYAGFIAYFDQPIFASDCSTIQPKDNRLLSKFLYRLLKYKQEEFYALQVGMGQPHVYPKDYLDFMIPLPPLSVQKEIVAEIKGYQKVIDGARAIVDNYRPHIPIRPEWPMVELADIAENDWGNTTLTKSAYVEDGPYLGVSAAGCDGRMNHAEHKVGTLVLSAIGANCGRMFFPKEDFTAIKNTITIKPHADAALPLLMFTMLEMSTFPRRGGGQPFIAKGDVLKHQIPLPPLAEQRAIVEEIEAEQALVNANRELIARMEKKIQAVLARVWGE
ncbi:MAG TPA: N-6 DNA methylase [Kiritimatiellia bacterium]|nr:N-6 DNA methylase [Kiritimatiellia bacterium]